MAGQTEIVFRDVAQMMPHPDNPRKSVEGGIEALARSIRENPDYFEARPILLSDRDGTLRIIGGERRWEAAKHLGMRMVPTILLSGLTEEREKELMIKDNTHTGIWDTAKLKGWDADQLKDWGVELKEKKATEKLSDLKFNDIYYEPENRPDISLMGCLDFDKFNAKIRAIEESGLTKAQKNTMKWFAYRFIKIDFESVANYYAFNATEKEKEIMQRLRLVLVDDGSVEGFIADEIMKINGIGSGSDE